MPDLLIARGEVAQGLNMLLFRGKSSCTPVIEMTSTVCKPERNVVVKGIYIPFTAW